MGQSQTPSTIKVGTVPANPLELLSSQKFKDLVHGLQDKYDVIIIGGGIMGSATAYSLITADDRLRLAVIERDPTYERASTTLSMCNARIQFSLKQNIQISQYAFRVLESFEDDIAVEEKKPNIAYRREGNLFVIDEGVYRGIISVMCVGRALLTLA